MPELEPDSEETKNSTPHRQSKSALKKQLKRQRIEAQREARKSQRKKLKKEKQARRRESSQTDISTRVYHGTKKEDKQRLLEALDHGVRLVIDLSLTHLMTDKEAGSLCRQLTVLYAENKRSLKPFHLYFTTFTGNFKKLFAEKIPTYVNWKADFSEESYLQIFIDEKESLLYLTADSSDDLSKYTLSESKENIPFKNDLILVVGGFIDRNRYKNKCLEKAQEEMIQTASLPLHLLEDEFKGSKVLTTNQCVEMLLKYNEALDWSAAINFVFPQRRRKLSK